jgi:hypothetical protein
MPNPVDNTRHQEGIQAFWLPECGQCGQMLALETLTSWTNVVEVGRLQKYIVQIHSLSELGVLPRDSFHLPIAVDRNLDTETVQ